MSYNDFYPTSEVCSGIITNKINPSTWEVDIYDSPIGQFNGPIPAGLIYSPGCESNFKKGDYIKVLVSFLFGGPNFCYQDVAPQSKAWILGSFQEKQVVEEEVEPKVSQIDPTTIGLRHPFSKAGLIASRAGHVIMSTQANNFIYIRNSGSGVLKNSINMRGQNFTRTISHNKGMVVKEQFLKYDGADGDEEASNITPDTRLLLFRRFVPSGQDLEKWTSMYEGTCAPLVPANNKFNEINTSKECVSGRITQNGDIRCTYEVGEEGDSFVRLRVDKVISEERTSSSGSGATPAILGNMAKISISDEGEIVANLGGNGLPEGNTYSISIKAGKDGLTINSKEKMSFTHGEDDEENNSIVMDPQAGIDVTAKNGFRVNGQEVVLAPYMDWMNTNKSQLCQVTSVGGPAPISTLALPEFEVGVAKFGADGGFTSKGIDSPSIGLIQEEDDGFASV